MSITHVIAHHINKQTGEDSVLSLRNTELENNSLQATLFSSLKNSLNTRLSRKHGSFDNEVKSLFLPDEMNKYLLDETQFISVTIDFMKAIDDYFKKNNGELNAHFLFFIEAKEKQSIFYLFIVNQNEYLTFNEKLEVMPSYSIDTGSSLCGLKLNIDDWQQRPKYPYITLVPPKGNEIFADAIHELSGFGNKVDKVKSTQTFLENIESFSKNIPEEKQQEFRKQIIDYCAEQEAKDEAVHIPTLSRTLEGIDCEKFIREMLPHNPKQAVDDAEQEIMVDKRSLRRYVKFSGRDKDLSLTFSSDQLNVSIFFDDKADTLVIKNIPKSLKKQLQSHFKKMES